MSAQVFRAPRSVQPVATSGAGPGDGADLAADLAALTRVILGGTPAPAPDPLEVVEPLGPAPVEPVQPTQLVAPITPTAPVGFFPGAEPPAPVVPAPAVELPALVEQVVGPAVKAAPGSILRELTFLDD